MRRLALAFALGIAIILVMLPSAASAWSRFAQGAVVVASPGVGLVAAPRVSVSVAVVRPVFPGVFVSPPRAVIVAAPVPFFAVGPVRHCARWWWDGWRWVWTRKWC